MPMSNMYKDSISLIKNDGRRVNNIKCSVQTNTIFLNVIDIPIEPKDIVIRKMSNGAEETFLVIDPNFFESIHGIKAHYQMTVKKLGLPEAKEAIQNITYNISGNNARVNNHSTDNSVNTVTYDSGVEEHINMLRSEINRTITNDIDKNSSLEIVDAIEIQFQSDKPSKMVVSTLINALPSIGSVASIGSFLIAYLSS